MKFFGKTALWDKGNGTVSIKEESSEKQTEDKKGSGIGKTPFFSSLNIMGLFKKRRQQGFKTMYAVPCVRDKLYVAGIFWLIVHTVETLAKIRPTSDPDGDIILHLLFYPLCRGYGVYHGILALVLLLGVILAVSVLSHLTGYELCFQHDILVRKGGLFVRKTTEIEYSDIRSVHIERNWWQILMFTGDLYISTGGWGYDIEIRGVSRPWRFLPVIWERKEHSILFVEYLKQKMLLKAQRDVQEPKKDAHPQ